MIPVFVSWDTQDKTTVCLPFTISSGTRFRRLILDLISTPKSWAEFLDAWSEENFPFFVPLGSPHHQLPSS